MYTSVNFSMFLDSFSETYRHNFSYEGKRALFDYLESYEDETGERVELDTVALCCEYSEHDSALEAAQEYTEDITDEKKAREYLEDHTQVIDVSTGGVIIQDF